jgi:acetaldehyde dehydrogenase (acetylating)
MLRRRIKVAIIGTGNIGSDLCARMLRIPEFEVVALVGRRADSPGLKSFSGGVKNIITDGIEGLERIHDQFEGFFDATSASDHLLHWQILKKYNKWAIDLTPSGIGVPMVPELVGLSQQFTIQDKLSSNYSMVTCGGQSSAPLIYAMSKYSKGISDVEVSSSIASKSAGPATRKNIDQYIETTEKLVQLISGCRKTKAILILNPADPPVMMRTTVQMSIKNCNLQKSKEEVVQIANSIKKYVPGYNLVSEPFYSSNNVLTSTVKVVGAGYFLPTYAGNLDIINAAAVETAKRHSYFNLGN